jgi:heterodisulfide reductase subunit C
MTTQIEKIVKLDPSFKYEVAGTPGGETVKQCFQCGKCEATCPIRRFRDQYRPAQVIRAVMLGDREMALESPTIWLCATCYSCSERCPQGVHFTDIMRVLRNMATAQGKANPFYQKTAEVIIQNGKTFPDAEFINEMHSDLGLPPIEAMNREEFAKDMKDAKSLNKIMHKEPVKSEHH